MQSVLAAIAAHFYAVQPMIFGRGIINRLLGYANLSPFAYASMIEATAGEPECYVQQLTEDLAVISMAFGVEFAPSKSTVLSEQLQNRTQ